MNPDHYLTLYTKINSKQIKGHIVTASTIKLTEGNIGVNVHDLGLGNDFIEVTPKVQITTTKNRQPGLYQN